MKINRWIYVPLNIALTYACLMFISGFLFNQPFTFGMFIFWLVGGAGFGFILQYNHYRKARKVSKGRDKRAFDIYQNRNLVLLINYDKSFDLCRKAVLSLKKSKIKSEDFQTGKITAKIGGSWETWGENVDLNVKRINRGLTEIEISVSPLLKTMIVSYGRSWKIAEDICKYLKEKDSEINQKVLVDSASILDEVYVKPFQKEKVER